MARPAHVWSRLVVVRLVAREAQQLNLPCHGGQVKSTFRKMQSSAKLVNSALAIDRPPTAAIAAAMRVKTDMSEAYVLNPSNKSKQESLLWLLYESYPDIQKSFRQVQATYPSGTRI